jgi:hypothetical protein
MNTPLQPGLPRNCDAEIPELLRPWVEVWSERGLPRTLLTELGIHLLQQPVKDREMSAVAAFLDRVIEIQENEPDLEDDEAWKRAKAKEAKPLEDRTPREYQELGEQQAQMVVNTRENHPLLRLQAKKSEKWRLRAGLREALETLIDYRPDPRRKNTDKETAAVWKHLLSTIDPLSRHSLEKFCGGSRNNIVLLLNAVIGVPSKQKGLLDLLHERFRDGSSERIRAVHDQAWLNADGKALPKGRGSIKAANIAAGLLISTPADALQETPESDSAKRQTPSQKEREEKLRQRNESEARVEKHMWLSVKARKRKSRQRSR